MSLEVRLSVCSMGFNTCFIVWMGLMTTAVVEHRLGFLPRWPGQQPLSLEWPDLLPQFNQLAPELFSGHSVLLKWHQKGPWVSSDPCFTSASHSFYDLLPLNPSAPRSTPSHLLTSGIHPIFILPNKPNTCLPLRWLLTGACGYEALVADCCSADEWAALP